MVLPAGNSAALNIILLWLGFFAGWTLVSVPLTLVGAPFAALWLAFAGGLGGALLALQSENLLSRLLLVAPAATRRERGGVHVSPVQGVVTGGAIFAGIVFFIPTNDARPLWAVCVLAAAFSLYANRSDTEAQETPLEAQKGPHWPAVVLLGGVIWLGYIFILRHDADDAFYLNLPVGLINAPHGMLQWDTMYGAENWPLLGSNYRVESLPTLTAALSWVSGVPVVYVAHLLLPTIWCFVWAATLAVIGTAFFGHRWWVFAILAVLSSFAFAGTLQSWGAHGLARLFHGKAPLILIVIPLIYILVWRMEVQATPLHFGVPLLAGLVCVAVGLTANAIYLAPLALGLAVFASWVARGFAMPGRLLLMTAAAPAVVAGVWLMLFDTPVTVPEDAARSFSHLGLWNMFPNKLLLGLMGLSITVVALAALLNESGRFITACLMGACLFVVNPFLWPLYDDFVTGGLNFRLWWALPFPLLFAVLLSWAILLVRRPLWPGAFAVFALSALSLTPSGLLGIAGTEIKPSFLKRPAGLLDVMERVRTLAQGNRVLAVETLSTWLPTAPDSPPLVYVRQIYLDQNGSVVDAQELEPRRLLAAWINGTHEVTASEISTALRDQCVDLLVFAKGQEPAGFGVMAARHDATLLETAGGQQIYRINPGCR